MLRTTFFLVGITMVLTSCNPALVRGIAEGLANTRSQTTHGSSYSYSEPKSSSNTRYTVRGNTIRGSDGTRCRTVGRTTRCY